MLFICISGSSFPYLNTVCINNRSHTGITIADKPCDVQHWTVKHKHGLFCSSSYIYFNGTDTILSKTDVNLSIAYSSNYKRKVSLPLSLNLSPALSLSFYSLWHIVSVSLSVSSVVSFCCFPSLLPSSHLTLQTSRWSCYDLSFSVKTKPDGCLSVLLHRVTL